MNVEPVKEFSGEEIKAIRKEAKMTQAVLASVLGVSKKAVEAWECGQNIPSGPASRLLSIIETDPSFPERYGILTARTVKV